MFLGWRHPGLQLDGSPFLEPEAMAAVPELLPCANEPARDDHHTANDGTETSEIMQKRHIADCIFQSEGRQVKDKVNTWQHLSPLQVKDLVMLSHRVGERARNKPVAAVGDTGHHLQKVLVAARLEFQVLGDTLQRRKEVAQSLLLLLLFKRSLAGNFLVRKGQLMDNMRGIESGGFSKVKVVHMPGHTARDMLKALSRGKVDVPAHLVQMEASPNHASVLTSLLLVLALLQDLHWWKRPSALAIYRTNVIAGLTALVLRRCSIAASALGSS